MYNKEIDFTELLEENYVHESREPREWDEWDDEELSLEEEHKWDGLDPAFSSWQDYYNYMYG